MQQHPMPPTEGLDVASASHAGKVAFYRCGDAGEIVLDVAPADHDNASMSESAIARALSVRQPYLELILLGRKQVEFRSRPTRLRERVYLYASTFVLPGQVFEEAGLAASELPVGLLLGSVEIVDCVRGANYYEWRLAKPQRLESLVKPDRRPQPAFFFPFTAVTTAAPKSSRTR